MAVASASEVTRSVLRGYLSTVRTIVSSSCRTAQLQQLTKLAESYPTFHTAINPAFRQPLALMSTTPTPKKKVKRVNITFIDRDGDEHTVQAKVGDSLLEVAKEYDIDLEGACEGTLSCSTCHLIVDPEWYDKIPDPLTEEEQDMLDLAYGLTDMSRLGCQILVTEKLEGLRLNVPAATRDVRDI